MRTLALVALLALSACVSLRDLHAPYHCDAEADQWRPIAPPADADTYRQLARMHWSADDGEFPDGAEHWFSGAQGVTKYCVVELSPANCETRDGVWWDFTPSADGPTTQHANYGVCLT